jgi:hypothetical protein
MVSVCCPTTKDILRRIHNPVKGFGTYSISQVRPLLRSATACNVGTTASGFVPVSELDGGSSDLRFDGGDREGLDCIFPSFKEVFSAFTRELCVLLFLWGPL